MAVEVLGDAEQLVAPVHAKVVVSKRYCWDLANSTTWIELSYQALRAPQTLLVRQAVKPLLDIDACLRLVSVFDSEQ